MFVGGIGLVIVYLFFFLDLMVVIAWVGACGLSSGGRNHACRAARDMI